MIHVVSHQILCLIMPFAPAARQEPTSVSIPSRYRTVVYNNNESKGFNSRVSRFPGPEIVSFECRVIWFKFYDFLLILE